MRLVIATVLVAAACGGSSGGEAADARVPGPCGDVWIEATPPPGTHVEVGTPIEYPTNPPSGGAHYPVWARWDEVYDAPIDRGAYVHNAEHGGVALLYRCDAGCPDVVAALTSLLDALPTDAACTPPLRTRTIVTPDPLLPDDVQVGASAWGAAYSATCLDLPSLRAWIDEHRGLGPEDTCAQGGVP